MEKPQPTTSEKMVWFYQGLALLALAVLMAIAFGIPYPMEAKAQMFPSDAITVTKDMHNATQAQQLFATSTEARTVWYVSASCNNVGDIAIYPGGFQTQPVQRNWLDTEGVVSMEQEWGAYEWRNKEDVWITKVGQTQCHVSLTYSPRVSTTTPIASDTHTNFQETLVISCVIIFFLAILAWPTFTRMFRRQEPI